MRKGEAMTQCEPVVLVCGNVFDGGAKVFPVRGRSWFRKISEVAEKVSDNQFPVFGVLGSLA
jgi:hypothetical protein